MMRVSNLAPWLRIAGRSVLIVGGYLICFLALEKAGMVVQTGTGLSPWHLSAGLSMALLLAFGLRYSPALAIAPLLSNLLLPVSLKFEWHVQLILALNFALNSELLT